MNPRPIEAVFFDFDGVLMDSEPIHFRCWRELLTPLGIEIDWTTFATEYVGVADTAVLRQISRKAANGTTFEQLAELLPRKRQIFLERMCCELPVADNCREMLAALSHLRLAVVTSSARAEVAPVLASAGLLDSFDVLVCGEDVDHRKPSPEPYLKAATSLGVSSALVVEDSDIGVESARAAGFEVIQVAGPAHVWSALHRRLWPARRLRGA